MLSRAVDILSTVLLGGAGVAFTLGVNALAGQRDLVALYWLVVGALLVRAAVAALRPKVGAR